MTYCYMPVRSVVMCIATFERDPEFLNLWKDTGVKEFD